MSLTVVTGGAVITGRLARPAGGSGWPRRRRARPSWAAVSRPAFDAPAASEGPPTHLHFHVARGTPGAAGWASRRMAACTASRDQDVSAWTVDFSYSDPPAMATPTTDCRLHAPRPARRPSPTYGGRGCPPGWGKHRPNRGQPCGRPLIRERSGTARKCRSLRPGKRKERAGRDWKRAVGPRELKQSAERVERAEREDTAGARTPRVRAPRPRGARQVRPERCSRPSGPSGPARCRRTPSGPRGAHGSPGRRCSSSGRNMLGAATVLLDEAKPFSESNHFTVPVAMSYLLRGLCVGIHPVRTPCLAAMITPPENRSCTSALFRTRTGRERSEFWEPQLPSTQ
ncbi:hypothetical protein TPAU25S_00906 [Tsukamurella paurometabola]